MKAPPRFELPPEFAALLGDKPSDALREHVEYRDGEAALAGFKIGLRCGIGEHNAEIVFADLLGKLDQPNSAYARARGCSRAAISRTLNQCRRNLGLPLRSPAKARAGNSSENSTSAKRIGNIRKLAKWHGPELAAELLGKHWQPNLSGKRTTNDLLSQLIEQIEHRASSDRGHACDVVRGKLMGDAEEQREFLRLVRHPDATLYRFTHKSQTGGWYSSRDHAAASWDYQRPAFAVETTVVAADAILAVKKSTSGFEVVLVPGSTHSAKREALRRSAPASTP